MPRLDGPLMRRSPPVDWWAVPLVLNEHAALVHLSRESEPAVSYYVRRLLTNHSVHLRATQAVVVCLRGHVRVRGPDGAAWITRDCSLDYT